MDNAKVVGLDPKPAGKKTPWAVSLDGPNQDQMRKRLIKIEQQARNKIFSTSAEILGQCPHPLAAGGSVTGLALGKVQSGKTSSFITVAAQAFDNGFRVVVVLAGTKNNLLRQNTERIKKELATDRPMEITIRTTEAGSTLTQENLLQLVKVERPVIITALKHPKHINDLANLFNHPDLVGIPVMIIDDEGDQASLNSRPTPKRSKKGEISND